MIKDLLDIQLEHSLHGNFTEGWRIIQQLQKERFWDNRVKFNAGWYYLRQGNMKKGMELINQGRFEKVFGSGHIGTNKPIYDGRPLNNENILFHCEGGFGDEIIGIRFAKEIKKRGGNTLVICHPQLKTMFERVDGVTQVLNRDNGALKYPHSFWVPAMASELVFGCDFNTISREPYIIPDPIKVEHFKDIIKSNKLKIGIKFFGNPEFEHEQHRIFPPELMFNALDNKGIQLYSLQLEHDLVLPDNIIDCRPYMRSWEDTAGIISNLDLVVTSCSGIGHLSGSIGKTTWIIPPILSYYVWAFPRDNDEKTWYYDNVRLFRQEKYGSWVEPFNKIKTSLNQFIGDSK